MPPLPRAECSVCGKLVPIRRNGTAREHRNPWDHPQPFTVCDGSGKPVEIALTDPPSRPHRIDISGGTIDDWDQK